MCLLINQPAGTKFTEAFLRGVYAHNKDGIGVMYAEDSVITIHKMLPTTFADVVDFMDEQVAGRECAIHFRMQTHGDIDLANCHPYEVLTEAEGYPLWLMHNGVLHTDNTADKSKSDTWHYINDFLRPMLLNNPEFYKTEAFKILIGDHIGKSNKFALINAEGHVVTVNQSSGVQYNGAWLSNTYAWDTTGTEHDVLTTWSRNTSNRSRIPYSTLGSLPLDVAEEDEDIYYSRQAGLDVDDEDEDEDEELTASVADMNDWTDAVYELLELHDLKTLSQRTVDVFDVLDDYYSSVGPNRAWEMLDCMYDGTITLGKATQLIKDGLTATQGYYNTDEEYAAVLTN